MKQASFHGRIFYLFFHYPKGWIKKLFQRGLLLRAGDEYERRQMEKSATSLVLKTAEEKPQHTISFLSGSLFWYETAYCIHSFLKYSDLPVAVDIYNDGSLTPKQSRSLLKMYRWLRIVDTPEIEEKLDTYLPRESFPSLRKRRLEYPHLRKLTDIHIGSQGWKLVFDSDMLFCHSPDELVSWMQDPQVPCHLIDTTTSYGYSLELLEQIAGYKIREKVNVGITGLASEDIDWELMERWCSEMIEAEGTHYTQEQALIAMLVSSTESVAFPQDRYQVMPSEAEVRSPQAILHHYVAESKPYYYRYGWKHFQKL